MGDYISSHAADANTHKSYIKSSTKTDLWLKDTRQINKYISEGKKNLITISGIVRRCCIYLFFHAYIHLKFKHAVLGTHLSSLPIKAETTEMRTQYLTDVIAMIHRDWLLCSWFLCPGQEKKSGKGVRGDRLH